MSARAGVAARVVAPRSAVAPGGAERLVAAGARVLRVRAVPRTSMVLVDGRAADWKRVVGPAAALAAAAPEVEVDIRAPAPVREAVLRESLGRVPVWLVMPDGLRVPAREVDLALAALWRPLAAHRICVRVRRSLHAALWVLAGPDQVARAIRAVRADSERRLVRALREEPLGALHRALFAGTRLGAGVGPVTAAAVLRHLAHPLRFRNARRLWAHCGLGVHSGRAVRGTHVRHSEPLRRALLALPGIWQRCPSCAWAALHAALLPGEEERHARLCGCGDPHHARRRAWRRVVKRWIAEVWWEWRLLTLGELEEAGWKP